MEMGTGKTRTMLEIIKNKYDKGKIEKVIWLCPCSAKINIKKELEKHIKTGHDIFIIAGIESLSSSVALNSFLYNYVQEYNCLLVVDESSKIKNHFCVRSENINRLGEYCTYKFILNGTPITKDEGDLFNQFYFLDWRILGYKSFWSYSRNHIKMSVNGRKKSFDMINTDYLTKKTALYSYQVNKKEVLDLPEKTYGTSYFNITQQQDDNYINYYSGILNRYGSELGDLDVYQLFAGLQMITSGYYVELNKENKIIKTNAFDDFKNNPRFTELISVISKIPDNEKVIIFCEFTDEVLNISKLLNEIFGRNTALPYYGILNEKDRNEQLEKFEKTSRFLVANKDCAGYSLNLQFCNYVIYYNNDWDYGTRAQSEDRVHRIGQKNDVTYIDIVAADTIDESIINCLLKKENLANNINKNLNKYNKQNQIADIIKGRYKKVEKIKEVEDLIDKKIC